MGTSFLCAWRARLTIQPVLRKCGVIFTGTIIGGTGRFERAQGTLSGTGSVDLTASTLTAELRGTINKDPMPF